MEEKKLTDEEIVKALEMHVNSDGKYSFEEWDRCKTVTQSDILDLIHRLQSEIEYKTDCYNDLCNMNNEIYMEMSEQKAEIERLNLAVEGLTSVNNVLDKENTNVIALNDALYREKTELQKQVDELTEENGYLKQCADTFLDDCKREKKQAVKETAKEILSMFDDRNYITEKELKQAIAERYGLEVE